MKEPSFLKTEILNESIAALSVNSEVSTDLSEQSDPDEDAGYYAEEIACEEIYLTPECRFADPDPYFKFQGSSTVKRHSVWFDGHGNLHAKNLSAWWIPNLTIEREIKGTIYTVTGSFSGDECMLRKLERISGKSYAGEKEDADDSNE